MMTQSERLLRSLDAAEAMTHAQHERARDELRRILANPPVPATTPSPKRGRATVKRAGVLGAAAIGLSVAALTLPGSTDDATFAGSWVATASPISEPEAAPAVAECRRRLSDMYAHDDTIPGIDYAHDPVVLTERRGNAVAVMIEATRADHGSMCLSVLPPGSATVTNFRDAGGGSDQPRTAPDPGTMRAYTVGQDDLTSMTLGRVGPDVIGVTVHAGSYTTQATVREGAFVAWWPGTAFAGHGADDVSFDLTLADGTVLRDVP